MHEQNFVARYATLIATALILSAGLLLYSVNYRNYADVLFGAMSLFVLVPLIIHIVKSIGRKQFGLDILAAIAIGSALALGEYLAAIVIALMVASGQALEDYAKHRARTELNSLLKRAPKLAHRKNIDKYLDVAIEQIAVGDILLVKPGETIPVDGLILNGTTSIDESALTGESMPVEKRDGQEVMSGSINQQAPIEIRALRTSRESQYEQIVSMVAEAASSKSPLVRMADTYSVPFTVVSLLLAGGAWAWSGEAVRALEVLVLATPCPLLIATPVAIVSGMSRAARGGIIVKHGGALETLAKTKAVAFDKTGTLTAGQPLLEQIAVYEKACNEDELLQMTAAIESNSAHALGKAIVDAALERKLDIPSITNVEETVGNGLTAQYRGQQLIVGKQTYLESHGIVIPKGAVPSETDGQTSICVAYGGAYAGMLLLRDELRTDTVSTIERMRSLGIQAFMMLTGDKKAVAERVGQEAGITDIEAECLPGEKLHKLRAFREKHQPLTFVGDGINDAPSLAAADVGIALGAKGSTAASEAADVVIMLDDFSKVADSVAISQRSVSIARQSIFVGIGLSLVLMLTAAATGLIKPVYGALLQEAVDVIVILNALRARR